MSEGGGISFGLVMGGLVIAFLSCTGGFGGGLLVGWAAHESSTDDGPPGPFPVDLSAPPAELPPVDRQVPRHAATLLDGCNDRDLAMVLGSIDSAIELGAPTYNRGDFAGCYEIYRSTAQQIEEQLNPRCPGPAAALAQGRHRASQLTDSSAQAWAMRDAFDGVIEVIQRRLGVF